VAAIRHNTVANLGGHPMRGRDSNRHSSRRKGLARVVLGEANSTQVVMPREAGHPVTPRRSGQCQAARLLLDHPLRG